MPDASDEARANLVPLLDKPVLVRINARRTELAVADLAVIRPLGGAAVALVERHGTGPA